MWPHQPAGRVEHLHRHRIRPLDVGSLIDVDFGIRDIGEVGVAIDRRGAAFVDDHASVVSCAPCLRSQSFQIYRVGEVGTVPHGDLAHTSGIEPLRARVELAVCRLHQISMRQSLYRWVARPGATRRRADRSHAGTCTCPQNRHRQPDDQQSGTAHGSQGDPPAGENERASGEC